MERHRIAARSSFTSTEPRTSGRSGTHHYSNSPSLPAATAKARALRRRFLTKLIKLMTEEGRLLVREYGPGGGWFISPGGLRVSDSVAHQLSKRANLEPHDLGLFSGHVQSFRVRP